MWPFRRKQSRADLAVEWMPRAINVATQKWVEFENQPLAASMGLDEKIYLFTQGLAAGLRQWKAFEAGPDALMLLVAAKGVERSRTYLRVEIETALGITLPEPHERTDAEESQLLTAKLVDRVSRKWGYFSTALIFRSDVPLEAQIESFKAPFLHGVRADFAMLRDAPEEFFDSIITLGIVESGTHSIDEVERALGLAYD
ncbi:MAG TPA: hypothetical protein VKI45_02210 [Allosphingosinicella sp.]|nr:hypothetical protein [Allosphingosinicella sp.]